MESRNPFTNELIARYSAASDEEIESLLRAAVETQARWAATPFGERVVVLRCAAELLRIEQESLADLMASEMGKLVQEARAEVKKCALGVRVLRGARRVATCTGTRRDGRLEELRELRAPRCRACGHAVKFPVLAGVSFRGPRARRGQRRRSKARLERERLRPRHRGTVATCRYVRRDSFGCAAREQTRWTAPQRFADRGGDPHRKHPCRAIGRIAGRLGTQKNGARARRQ